MFAETYLTDGLQMEASLQKLKLAGCTYLLVIKRLCTPPNPKIVGMNMLLSIERLARDFYISEEVPGVTLCEI